MDKDNEMLDKVIIFLVILVGAILLFTQYQFYMTSSGYLVFISGLLILVLIGSIVWYLLQKPQDHKAHHEALIEKSKPLTSIEKASYVMVAIVAVLVIFNQMQLSQASALAGIQSGLSFKSSSLKTPLALTGDPTQDAIAVVIPRGMPFYGQQLGVSFADPINSLEIVAQLDPSYGRSKIQLTAEEKQRYIQILTIPSMGCQYCCGADTAVSSNGQPTCGCKHSWAMRGLAAYLIKNYPDLSDEEIMREISKWKGLFFPKQMVAKYIQESQSGQYSPDIASLLLDVDEEKIKEMRAAVASSGSAQSESTVADIDSLPSMVGGC